MCGRRSSNLPRDGGRTRADVFGDGPAAIPEWCGLNPVVSESGRGSPSHVEDGETNVGAGAIPRSSSCSRCAAANKSAATPPRDTTG